VAGITRAFELPWKENSVPEVQFFAVLEEKAQGARHKAQGTRRKAEGTRRKAQGRRRKAQGARLKGILAQDDRRLRLVPVGWLRRLPDVG
jgi:hypothetical protein